MSLGSLPAVVIIRLSATPEDLKALDLYSPLSAMSKHVDPEHDPFEGPMVIEEGVVHADVAQAERGSRKRKGKELTQREQARQKKKQAVLAKIQEQGQTEAGSVIETEESEKGSKKPKAAEGEASS